MSISSIYDHPKLAGKVTPLAHGGEPPHDGGMEARVARLEAGMEHVVRELVDIRQDIRDLRRELHSTTKWLLAAYGAGFIILLGAMAHGFHWL